MRVAHFSTFIDGGAAIAARRQHEALLAAGVDSVFFYQSHSGEPPDDTYRRYTPSRSRSGVVKYLRERLRRRRIWRLADEVDAAILSEYEIFSLPRRARLTRFDPREEAFDIINLHWVANMLDYPSFFSTIPDNYPIVWTLHDMNPFTGGCHYSFACRDFTTHCRRCPQLSPNCVQDHAADAFDIKATSLADKRLHVVADSHWLEREARASRLFTHARSFSTIHYSLNVETFAPVPRQAARRALGIETGTFVVAFCAERLSDRRKGLQDLMEALTTVVKHVPLSCLTFGHGPAPAPAGPISVINFGTLSSPLLMRLIYSCADVFVIPSRQEAFGQTSLEAMSCGTPVVGSDVGGIPDMVTDLKTGRLFRPGDAAHLAEQLTWMASHPDERMAMGRTAREMVLREFTPPRQATRYIELYESALNAASQGYTDPIKA